MNAPANRCRALAAALIFGAALISGSAFTFIKDSRTNLPIKWPAGEIPIRIMLGDAKTLQDGSTYNSSVRTAAQTWNARIGSAQLVATLTTGTPGSHNGINEVAFSSDVFGRAFEENVLAVTTTWERGTGSNQRTEGDLLFNTAYTWDSYRGSRQTVLDIQRVAIHELGHLLGLDHPDDDNQTVNAIMNSRIGNLDTLANDDIQGAQAMYGPPGVPANNNFANATLIELNAGSLGATGYNTNATKETGEPNHVSSGGRSVWWRWKPTVSANATIDTKGSYFDTALAVYSGTALNALTPVASNDDIENGVVQASSVSFATVANTTYMIAVDGFNNNDGNGADSGGIKLNLALDVSAGSPPSIVTQPAGATAAVGGSATFSVTASGSEPLSYQWLFNGLPISGATASSYTVNNIQNTDGGTYSVTVTNPAGSVTSNGVTLTIRATTPTTPTPTPSAPSSGGGGGGGGAPSEWFLGSLVILGIARFVAYRRR